MRGSADRLLKNARKVEDAYAGHVSHVRQRQVLVEILVDEGQHTVEATSVQGSSPAWRIGLAPAFRVVLGERGDQIERERVHAQAPGRPLTAKFKPYGAKQGHDAGTVDSRLITQILRPEPKPRDLAGQKAVLGNIDVQHPGNVGRKPSRFLADSRRAEPGRTGRRLDLLAHAARRTGGNGVVFVAQNLGDLGVLGRESPDLPCTVAADLCGDQTPRSISRGGQEAGVPELGDTMAVHSAPPERR